MFDPKRLLSDYYRVSKESPSLAKAVASLPPEERDTELIVYSDHVSAEDLASQASGETGGVPFAGERLFPGVERIGETFPDDLRKFAVLRIRGLPAAMMSQSVFDLAYYLREVLRARIVEPDVAVTLPLPPDEPPTTIAEAVAAVDFAWALRKMRVVEAWDYSRAHGRDAYGEAIRIGHPDTGYALHEDLDLSRLDIASGYNFVDYNHDPIDPLGYTHLNPGHGLATASVLVSEGGVTPPPTAGYGGTTGPGRITGVAPGAKLVPIRAIKSVIRVSQTRVVRAICHAVHSRCNVVSLSLGGIPSTALHAAVRYAVRNGLIVVAAAGNRCRWVVWPAAYPECIAMAATGPDDRPWGGSAHGERVAVSAPGHRVWRAFRREAQHPLDQIGPSDGTSYATAHVAGIAALWLAHHGQSSMQRTFGGRDQFVSAAFKGLLRDTASVPPQWNQREYGSGIANARDLLEAPIPSMTDLEDPLSSYESYDGIISALVHRITWTSGSSTKRSLADALWNADSGPLDEIGHELVFRLMTLVDEGGPADLLSSVLRSAVGAGTSGLAMSERLAGWLSRLREEVR